MPKRKKMESVSERRKEDEDDDRTSESDEGSGPEHPLRNAPDNHEIMEYRFRKAYKKDCKEAEALEEQQHKLQDAAAGSVVEENEEVNLKSQVIQILGILDEAGSTGRERSLEETMYIDSFVGRVRFVSSSRSSGSTGTSLNDWAMRAKECLFGPPIFRIGRVMAADDCYSGTGWFHGGQFVITCAHVVHSIQRQNQDIVLQLPSDNVLIDLEIVYVCSHTSLRVSYLRDIAVLRMTGVRSPRTISLGSLPLGSLDAGDPIWAMKCLTAGVLKPEPQCQETQKIINTGRVESVSEKLVTISARADSGFSGTEDNKTAGGAIGAGVLKPEPQCQETQKMINTGRVESVSEKLVTISARADCGFSGGPVLNKHEQIIGMVQGGRGQYIKTVAIIPIDKISEIMDVVISMNPTCGLPPLPVPMQMGSPTVPF